MSTNDLLPSYEVNAESLYEDYFSLAKDGEGGVLEESLDGKDDGSQQPLLGMESLIDLQPQGINLDQQEVATAGLTRKRKMILSKTNLPQKIWAKALTRQGILL